MTSSPVISLVGAGGKSSTLFQLARAMVEGHWPVVFLTATSHLGAWQTSEANRHFVVSDKETLSELLEKDLQGSILITGEIIEDRASPIDEVTLGWLHKKALTEKIPLLIEADGSHGLPLKAPAEHEPPIPEFTDHVIVVAGVSALGKPLNDEHVHRAEIFAHLSGLKLNENITPASIIKTLSHPSGGLKNIPPLARRTVFLNQADTAELQSICGRMAGELLDHYDSVTVGSVQQKTFLSTEHIAGIILAAGQGIRFGSPKQLLDWKGKPFVRHTAETALHAGLRPVVVVTGFHAPEVEAALRGLPVNIIFNPDFQNGQSTSVRKGLEGLPRNIGASMFLLADQPQIPSEVIRALIDYHGRELPRILAPLVHEERRANPVLFDKVTFLDLMQLSGDVGGRAIFDKHHVDYLPWHDDTLLLDVDKPEDYQRLMELE